MKQHFSGIDNKSKKIQRFTKRISFEITGSELIALLYESDLIKKYKPIYNRSQRRTIYQYGLYMIDVHGYKGLSIQKIQLEGGEITTFTTLKEGKAALFRITEKYRLCQKINGLYKSNTSCFQYQIKECYGACMALEPCNNYNRRVEAFISNTCFENFTQLFRLPGREENEIGIVYIEKGIYKGFGFCPSDTLEKQQLNFISYGKDNRDVRRILMSYLTRKSLKL